MTELTPSEQYHKESETDLLKRMADYVRLEIETDMIKPSSPVGIAWRDYAKFNISVFFYRIIQTQSVRFR